MNEVVCDMCEAEKRDLCICPFCDEPCPNEECVYKETEETKNVCDRNDDPSVHAAVEVNHSDILNDDGYSRYRL